MSSQVDEQATKRWMELGCHSRRRRSLGVFVYKVVQRIRISESVRGDIN